MADKDRYFHASLMRIRNQGDFDAFRRWLDEEEAKAMKVLGSTQDDRQMYAAQGTYQFVTRLKNLIEASPVTLGKLDR